LNAVKLPAEKAGAVDACVCAEQAFAEGRPAAEVEALLAKAFVGDVELGPAFGLRALLAVEKGRLTKALTDAEKAVALCPNEGRGYYVRGRVRLERGKEGALADLEKAARLTKRKDGRVLHWLAAAQAEMGQAQEALATQREAAKLAPNDAEVAEQLR